MTVLTPLGFAQQDAAAAVRNVDVTLLGAQSSASAGNVTTGTLNARALSPLGFSQQARSFARAPGNVNVTLTGASAFAQAQGLLGATVNIIPDGISSVASAGAVTSSEDAGQQIENTTAQTSSSSNYSVDPITGFKQLPFNHPRSKLRKRWDGQVVRLDSLDRRHPLDSLESGGDQPQRGPQSPEDDDNFIETAITPDEL